MHCKVLTKQPGKGERENDRKIIFIQQIDILHHQFYFCLFF